MSDLSIIDKDKIISELIIRLKRLERRIRELEGLEKENKILRERPSKYENPKNLPLPVQTGSRPEERPRTFAQDTLGNRHDHQKWYERIKGPISYC